MEYFEIDPPDRDPDEPSEGEPRKDRDTWRDPDADSGLRLDNWLGESEQRNVLLTRLRDPDIGTRWRVVLTDGTETVANETDRHLEDAWIKALDRLKAAA
jgi:hypothetical protein